jgi:exportin-1
MDVLKVYQLFSEQIKSACASQGAIATRLMVYKMMRNAKADILDMFSAFFGVCKDIEGGPESIMPVMLPPLLQDVLTDYNSSPSVARDAKVLTLLSSIIALFKNYVTAELPRILDAVFQPTLEMITTNMLDFPEHRIAFFQFLRDANTHCFFGLFSMPLAQQKLLVDSIMWALKHTERNISETGLDILQELLTNLAPNPQISQPFYQAFLLSIIQDIMVVMTDRLHKSGFKSQAGILMHIFHQVQMGQVTVPLSEQPDNVQFLKEHVSTLLMSAFPNLTQAQVVSFVMGLFDVSKDLTAFKQHLRDFLIAIKEFSSEDNSDLFAEEAEAQQELLRRETQLYRSSVPGLLKPDELGYENDSQDQDD